MLVEIPPKMSVSGFMGYLKGKSKSDALRAVW
ncbi:transposase [Escherichia coli TA464]|nr:transposase [Escherichia coli TA464]